MHLRSHPEPDSKSPKSDRVAAYEIGFFPRAEPDHVPWELVEFDIIAVTGWTYPELDAAPADRLMVAWDLYNTRAKGQSDRVTADNKGKGTS